MAGAKPLEIELDEDQYEAVMSAVASGDYASTSDVVGAALDEWLLDRHIDAIGVERLRELIDEGLASGPPEPFDVEEIKRKAREGLLRKR